MRVSPLISELQHLCPLPGLLCSALCPHIHPRVPSATPSRCPCRTWVLGSDPLLGAPRNHRERRRGPQWDPCLPLLWGICSVCATHGASPAQPPSRPGSRRSHGQPPGSCSANGRRRGPSQRLGFSDSGTWPGLSHMQPGLRTAAPWLPPLHGGECMTMDTPPRNLYFNIAAGPHRGVDL